MRCDALRCVAMRCNAMPYPKSYAFALALFPPFTSSSLPPTPHTHPEDYRTRAEQKRKQRERGAKAVQGRVAKGEQRNQGGHQRRCCRDEQQPIVNVVNGKWEVDLWRIGKEKEAQVSCRGSGVSFVLIVRVEERSNGRAYRPLSSFLPLLCFALL